MDKNIIKLFKLRTEYFLKDAYHNQLNYCYFNPFIRRFHKLYYSQISLNNYTKYIMLNSPNEIIYVYFMNDYEQKHLLFTINNKQVSNYKEPSHEKICYYYFKNNEIIYHEIIRNQVHSFICNLKQSYFKPMKTNIDKDIKDKLMAYSILYSQ